MTDLSQRILKLDDFIPYVGQLFEANCDPAPVAIRLVEASPLADYGASERAPFILIFHTPPETLLMSGHYQLRTASFPLSPVYLSDMLAPLGGEPGYYYQAVFN
jgi:hypothetical protein